MKRWLPLAALVAATGCDNVDSGLIFEKYVAPDDSCVVNPTDPATDFYRFDPFFQGDLNVFAVMTNVMSTEDIEFNEDLNLGIVPPTTVTITEFEHVFQCDESVVAGAGPLFLPLFGASGVPFCQDPRDTDAAFQGFDIRPVAAGTVRPSETQAVGIKLISGELARGFEEMFVLAVAAEVCCSAQTDPLCEQGLTEDLPDTPECIEVKNAVLNDRLPATQIETLRQYAQFDVTNPSGFIGSTYSLRVRGNYVGTTAGGRTVTSNESSLLIGLVGRDLEQQYLNNGQDVRDSLRAAFGCSSEILLD